MAYVVSSWQGFYRASPSLSSRRVSLHQEKVSRVGSVEKPAGEERSGRRFLQWVVRHIGKHYGRGLQPVDLTGGYCWRIYFKVLEVLFLGKFPQLFCLQRRDVEHTNFRTWGFANSIRAVSWHSHYARSLTWRSGPLHVHHKQSTSLYRHSWPTTLASSWKSMERSDGCQEKIVPRSETRPEKG
jgi:hypothetical protein